MRVCDEVSCDKLCSGVNCECFMAPSVDVESSSVRILIISEAAPASWGDYYYSEGDPLFARTTLQAFRDAGVEAGSIGELVERGFFFTTAVKCGKLGYSVPLEAVKECSHLLEKEMQLFPNLRAVMLMGDVAIRAFNEYARRATGMRVIPAGSTYKIRGTPYYLGDIRVFPSYLQAGPSFFIERSKRRMISEDIAEALRLVEG